MRPSVCCSHIPSQLSDLWALGCIIFQFLTGKPPFRGSNEYQTFQRITRFEFSFPDTFPAEAKDLVSKLLVSESSRLGADESGSYTAIKSHPFFAGVFASLVGTRTDAERATVREK
jgi:3-phosphoinositide dependent protein kinase-1